MASKYPLFWPRRPRHLIRFPHVRRTGPVVAIVVIRWPGLAAAKQHNPPWAAEVLKILEKQSQNVKLKTLERSKSQNVKFLLHTSSYTPFPASGTSSTGSACGCSEGFTYHCHCCNRYCMGLQPQIDQNPHKHCGGAASWEACRPSSSLEHLVIWFSFHMSRGSDLLQALLQRCGMGLQRQTTRIHTSVAEKLHHGKHVHPLLASKTSSSDSLSACSEDRTCCGHCCNPLAWACSCKATQPTLGSGGVEDFGGAEPECQVENFGEEQKSECQVLIAYQLVHPFSGLWHVLNRLGLRLFRGFHLPLPLLQSLLHGLAATNRPESTQALRRRCIMGSM